MIMDFLLAWSRQRLVSGSAEEMESRIIYGERSHRTRRSVPGFEPDGDPASSRTPHPAATMIIMFDVRAGNPSRRRPLRRRHDL